MEDICGAQRQEMVSSDSAYGSSAVDTDTEDGQTPTANTFPYNEDLTHKVITCGWTLMGIVKSKIYQLIIKTQIIIRNRFFIYSFHNSNNILLDIFFI